MRNEYWQNQVHEPDSKYNPYVVKEILNAKRAKGPRDLIDYITGGKEWSEIEAYRERDTGDTKEKLEIEMEL